MANINGISIDKRVTKLREHVLSSELFDVELAKTEITELIYNLMETYGLSKAALAKCTNTSRPYITKMLAGDVNFTITTLVKIARVFEHKLNVANLFIPSAVVAPTKTERSWAEVDDNFVNEEFKASPSNFNNLRQNQEPNEYEYYAAYSAAA